MNRKDCDERNNVHNAFKSDEVHKAVVSFPGEGKRRFFLNVIRRHIFKGECLLIVDLKRDIVILVREPL